MVLPIVDLLGGSTLLAVFSTLTLAALIWFWSRPSSKTTNVIPWAPEGMFGLVLKLSSPQSPFFLLDQYRKVNSPIFRLRVPLIEGWYVVADGSLACPILEDPSGDKTRNVYHLFSPLTGSSIFNSSTKSLHWKLVRKGTSPAFTTNEVHRMNAICNEHVNRWVCETLEPLIDSGLSFDPSSEMVKLTFRVICDAAFEYSPTDQEVADFVNDLDIIFREFLTRQAFNPLRYIFRMLIPEFHKALAAASRLRAFAKRVIDSYRQKKSAVSQVVPNTVVRLIADHPNLTEEQRIGEILTFLIAGHDTTGYTLASALSLLADHPEVAMQLRQELRTQEDSDWCKCEFLQYVIREVYRIHPVAAMGVVRTLGRDFTFRLNDKDITLPKGAIIQTPLILVHRNSQVFKNADVFDPLRWAQATPEMTKSLIPFAVGARNCIGQALAKAEIATVLPRLIHDYSFETKKQGRLEMCLTLQLSGCQLTPKRI